MYFTNSHEASIFGEEFIIGNAAQPTGDPRFAPLCGKSKISYLSTALAARTASTGQRPPPNTARSPLIPSSKRSYVPPGGGLNFSTTNWRANAAASIA